MNINVPSGRDGVHVYVLNKPEHGTEAISPDTDVRYLIVRERPSGSESWSEVVEPDSEENKHER
ncbi:hypothetical protein RY831_03615 [Noviherbaspirillum sp. CPCC 100848]|uniref:Uncharacterized protein n=1 Tax=Noviherbaspirillum album TaxID=3080276 RepID=A0ABU6J3M1_9BURK|nr:hypothetical protein [Noviherbaspirillum sp. CPCC 100848]MEC4718222.1 hypothetical protein [Noviherbaspirillum sp. CPCC 100848]